MGNHAVPFRYIKQKHLNCIFEVLKNYSKYFYLILFLSNVLFLSAQEDGGKKLRNKRKNPIVKTRIGFSPVLGLYKPNKNHTSGTKQKLSYAVSLKEEIRLDKNNRCFFMVGVDYMYHGLSFNSYYFHDDSIHFYNKSMNAKYNLTIHELDFPLQFKYSLKKENNSIFSSYLFAGYCYRWLLDNKLKVDYNGEDVADKRANLTFKLPAFSSMNSSFLSAGIGIQKNTPLRQNAVFAELQIRYATSPMYLQENFTPSSLYINSHFIYLTVGVKL